MSIASIFSWYDLHHDQKWRMIIFPMSHTWAVVSMAESWWRGLCLNDDMHDECRRHVLSMYTFEAMSVSTRGLIIFPLEKSTLTIFSKSHYEIISLWDQSTSSNYIYRISLMENLIQWQYRHWKRQWQVDRDWCRCLETRVWWWQKPCM